LLLMASQLSAAIFRLSGIHRGKKTAVGGGKSHERSMVEQAKVVMRIRSRLASNDHWLLIAHQPFDAGALPVAMQLRRDGSSALPLEPRVRLREKVVVASDGEPRGQWASLMNVFEELDQRSQWTVSF